MPTPISQLVADGVVAVVSGLALTPAPTVRKRKRPTVEQADGAGPLVVVSVGDEEEMEAAGWSPATPDKLRWLVRRPVAVAVAVRSGGLIGENATARAYREAVWPAVTLASLTARGVPCNDVFPRGRPIFDPAGLQAGWDWSVLSLTVETTEDRDP